jgi:FkbM family methyltransferase
VPRMRWRRDSQGNEPPDVPTAPIMFGNGLHRPLTDESIASLLEDLRATDLPSAEGIHRVDWMGVRTRIPMLPWSPQEFAGTVNSDLPIPTDGYRSEAVEYAALALSILHDRPRYRIVEVGAGWAPWAVAGLVLARRMGKHGHGIAVEVDARHADWAMQHAADNNVPAQLISGSPEHIRERILAEQSFDGLLVVHAACWWNETMLRFPNIDVGDMGGAVTPDPTATMDYRGAHLEYHDVPTVTLSTLLTEHTDLLHVDLQGMELQVVTPAQDLLDQYVRLLAVGTHDRLIEGHLHAHFLPHDWGLIADDPCKAFFDAVRPSLAGFTVQDGNQVYANARFRDTHPAILR